MWAGSRKEQKQVGTERRGSEGCQSVPNCHPDTRFTVALAARGFPCGLQGESRAGVGGAEGNQPGSRVAPKISRF